jgi:hypothetical protein
MVQNTAVIELLECLALAHFAHHLADEHDHRRRILVRDVDARGTHWWRRDRG